MILILAMAGGFGALVVFRFHSSLPVVSALPATGLAIGAAVGISTRIWIRICAAPILAASAILALEGFLRLSVEGSVPSVPALLSESESHLRFGVPAAPLLVAAHHVFLSWNDSRYAWTATASLYAASGALSTLLLFMPENPSGWIQEGIPGGTIAGLMQMAGMWAAVRLDETLHPSDYNRVV
jgi:hypothetical protein